MAISSRHDLQTGKSSMRMIPLISVLAKYHRSIRRAFYDCEVSKVVALISARISSGNNTHCRASWI
jgi:hypothetical protein